MDRKNARNPDTSKKNEYGFGVKDPPKPHSLEDIDNFKESLDEKDEQSSLSDEKEDIDPLDREEEVEKADEAENVEEDIQERSNQSDSESYNPKPVEQEPDRERTLADLAKEDIKDEEDLSASDQPFKTTNINLDSVSSKPNPYFNSGEEMEGEIHIPNLRSPRFNSEPNPVRRPLDQNLGDPYPQSPFERNSLRNGPPPKRGASKLHLVILLLLGIAVIGGTVYFLKTQFKGEQAAVVETPAPTSSPEPTPTPEPEPEANRVDFTVKVLNGTTTTGLASEVTEKLKELGYKTVKGANAPRQDYEQTLVSVKPGQEVLLKTLIKDLSFQFEASAGPELKENDPLDAQIILGKE